MTHNIRVYIYIYIYICIEREGDMLIYTTSVIHSYTITLALLILSIMIVDNGVLVVLSLPIYSVVIYHY